MSKKQPVEKKEEKQKFNYEELIFSNLSCPQLTFDKTGYTFTNLLMDVQKI